jgi:hypothetical protein
LGRCAARVIGIIQPVPSCDVGGNLGASGCCPTSTSSSVGFDRPIGAFPVLSRVVATREAHPVVPSVEPSLVPDLRATRTAGPSLRVSGQKADDFGIRGEPANRPVWKRPCGRLCGSRTHPHRTAAVSPEHLAGPCAADPPPHGRAVHSFTGRSIRFRPASLPSCRN